MIRPLRRIDPDMQKRIRTLSRIGPCFLPRISGRRSAGSRHHLRRTQRTREHTCQQGHQGLHQHSNLDKSTKIVRLRPPKLFHLSTSAAPPPASHIPHIPPFFRTFTAKSVMEYLANIPAKEIRPGFFGKMVHGEKSTLAIWEIKKGSRLSEHSHPHEQITYV